MTRALGDLPDPRGHVSSAEPDGKIHALGGDRGHDKTQIDVNSCRSDYFWAHRGHRWRA
jgi:hypothetical protein